MVFIASHWTPASATDVRVFSNCDEVALSLNGRLVERKGPDRDRISTRLVHPPFTFRTGGFTPGTLEAVGYVAGRTARPVVRTGGDRPAGARARSRPVGTANARTCSSAAELRDGRHRRPMPGRTWPSA
jgi:hypothetical protein